MSTFQFETVQVGSLECVVVGSETLASPELVVVMCHGFGASGTDLVGIAEEVLSDAPELINKIKFVFPAAPMTLAEYGLPDSRAWWLFDFQKMQDAAIKGELRNLRLEHPPELPARTEALREIIEALSEKWKISPTHFCLGGFSQGAMLATNYTLRYPDTRGLIIYSGTYLCADDWEPLITAHPGCPVLQSHGVQDPILPYILAEEIHADMQQGKFQIEFVPFKGGHTIPGEVLQKSIAFLRKLSE